MSSGFQQQVPTRGVFTRSAPQAQNGKTSDKASLVPVQKPSRSWEPRRPQY